MPATKRDAAQSAPKTALDPHIPRGRDRYQLPPGARGLAHRANVSRPSSPVSIGSIFLRPNVLLIIILFYFIPLMTALERAVE